MLNYHDGCRPLLSRSEITDSFPRAVVPSALDYRPDRGRKRNGGIWRPTMYRECCADYLVAHRTKDDFNPELEFGCDRNI